MHGDCDISVNELEDGVRNWNGIEFDVITQLERLQPFLFSVSSASDFWAYLGSHGGITAGRRNADHALFPYVTEDKLADTAHVTGAVTLIRTEAGEVLEPARGEAPGRWIAKSILGDEVCWGLNLPCGLRFRESWRVSPAYGLVRRCHLSNHGDKTRHLTLLDGLQNLLPAGVTQQTQNELSVLLDAYKRSEIAPSGLGIASLSSALTDLAEPSESLSATVAWSLGIADTAVRMASARQLPAFRETGRVTSERDVRGVRSAFLSAWSLTLAAGESTCWTLVSDTDLDAAEVHDLDAALQQADTLQTALQSDLDAARTALTRLVAEADGCQCTGDAAAAAHHRSSVLFNAMRGGVFRDGYQVERADLIRHLQTHDVALAARLEPLLDTLPETLSIGELIAWGDGMGDPDLRRLLRIYLPLSFARRHGDPSRPWNRFDIVLTDEAGRPVSGFQGNWRDIFQNWEALAWSYPEYIENMIALFLNATTVDGYNPYRITQSGIDWEVPEPGNPWSNIGYWNDHQIIYLLRLLKFSERTHPGRLAALLNDAIFASGDVPYRIAGFESILANPFDTISFDTEADRRARERALERGADGRLRHDPDGQLSRTTLADKLLTLLGAKLVNLVPGGGIWINNQRPEWNDANNALAGSGLSVVTAAYLLDYLGYLQHFLAGQSIFVRAETAALVQTLIEVLDAAPEAVLHDDAERAVLVRALGLAGERFRQAAYQDATQLVSLSAPQVEHLLSAAERWLRQTVSSNRRSDGLFHSYNVLDITPDTLGIVRLPLMLEGQVAVLASGLLSPSEVLELVQALRHSPLYRADQNSYLLYPDRDLPGFLERNTLSAEALAGIADSERLIADPAKRLLVADSRGEVHFAAGLRNAAALEQRMDRAEAAGLPVDRVGLLDAYEQSFSHATFMGRSGTFFAYEGLGSIYWHMVSKLALAVLEKQQASDPGSDMHARLARAYRDIRGGLGFAKPATLFGAFPSDAYSHTPSFAGARQPGMTGQVKEDVIARLVELGVSVRDGRLQLDPRVVAAGEWLSEPAVLELPGREPLQLAPDQLGFTLCGIPVLYTRGGSDVIVTLRGGEQQGFAGRLDAATSARVFQRDPALLRIEVVG